MEEKQGWIPNEDLHTMEGLTDAESGRRMCWRLACSETGGEDRVELTGTEQRFRKSCREDLGRAPQVMESGAGTGGRMEAGGGCEKGERNYAKKTVHILLELL